MTTEIPNTISNVFMRPNRYSSGTTGEIAKELTVDESWPRSRGSNVLADLKTREIEVLDELRKTVISGKILRRQLKELEI